MSKSSFVRALLLGMVLAMLAASRQAGDAQAQTPAVKPILLRSRQFTPAAGVEPSARAHLQSQTLGSGHVIVQLADIPTAEARAALAASGIRLLDYLPERAWFAAVTPSAAADLGRVSGLRWVGAIQPADRLSASLRGGRAPQSGDGTVSLYIRYFADVAEADARSAIGRHGGVVDSSDPVLLLLLVRVPATQLTPLASEDALRWITLAPPLPSTMNDTIRLKMRVKDVQDAPYNLNGAGVVLGIWDCGPVASHVDFGSRLINVPGQIDVNCGTNWHSTHVAGTMIGDGQNSVAQGGTANQWRGMAPGATLVSYDYATSPTTPYNEIQGAISNYGLDISNNSWGFPPTYPDTCSVLGNYDSATWAVYYDQLVNGLLSKLIPIVFSAGNERQSACSPTGYQTVIAPGTAKNVVSVGATDVFNDAIASFSSWGPTDDGRIKPDVVAPGYSTVTPSGSTVCASSPPYATGIKSTCPGGGGVGYGLKYGTSMSAPAVSGMFALMLQQYRQMTGQSTSMLLPSTFKALAIQGAVDLGNAGPDFVYGWGRVDAKNSVDLVRTGRWREGTITGGSLVTYTANVLSCDTSLKVTLAWDDLAGLENAAKELVNDLDLTLTDPTGTTTYYPWVLDATNPLTNAMHGVDSTNNVEQVLVNNPATGPWTIKVYGAVFPYGGAQRYSVVSEAFNTPTLASVSATPLQPGSTLVLHGANFEQGCSAQPLVVNFGGVTTTVPSNAFTRDTITVTVPLNAQSGLVSVTTPAATSNALYIGVTRPRLYLPAILRDWPPAFNWLDASGGTRLLDPVNFPNADDVTQTVALPFAFTFYGNTYSSVNVSSNGFVSFGSLDNSYPQHECIPSATTPDNAIYGYWVDLVPNDARPEAASYARAVWAKTVNGLFVIEWQEVPRFSMQGSAVQVESFEIVLYPQGYAVLQYQTVDDTADVTIGIEDSTGSRADQRFCSVSNPPPGTVYGTAPSAGTSWALLGQ
ncbi:MAG: S8 family serine peptidase [Chloroflexi bacterium]|nr:S8 family serine peptidase [Chloroflexota bacterium]